MSIDLAVMQEEHKDWLAHNFPNQQPHDGLLGAMEELGELAHAHLKAQQGIRGLDSFMDQMRLKADAIGDVVIYLISYCNTNGLSFEGCVAAAWQEVKARDWQANKTDGKVES